MSEPTTEKTTPEADPRLVVFGVDDSRKPHAAWFSEADAELAERAAGFMRMKVLKVISDDQRAVALQLPQGKVFASGRLFAPFVKLALYERLKGFEGVFEPAVPVIENDGASQPEPTYQRPATWADIAPGCVVLASEGKEEGWYPAIVIEKKADDLFIVRWKDWPEFDDFVRKPSHLALLPVANTPAAEPGPSA